MGWEPVGWGGGPVRFGAARPVAFISPLLCHALLYMDSCGDNGLVLSALASQMERIYKFLKINGLVQGLV